MTKLLFLRDACSNVLLNVVVDLIYQYSLSDFEDVARSFLKHHHGWKHVFWLENEMGLFMKRSCFCKFELVFDRRFPQHVRLQCDLSLPNKKHIISRIFVFKHRDETYWNHISFFEYCESKIHNWLVDLVDDDPTTQVVFGQTTILFDSKNVKLFDWFDAWKRFLFPHQKKESQSPTLKKKRIENTLNFV